MKRPVLRTQNGIDTLNAYLEETRAYMNKLEQDNAALVEENQALRNELDKYKKQVASDDKYLDKASFIELERDQLRNELEALKSQHDAMEITYLTTKKPLNKIKADAVLEFGHYMAHEMHDEEYAIVSKKYANKLEQDNAPN